MTCSRRRKEADSWPESIQHPASIIRFPQPQSTNPLLIFIAFFILLGAQQEAAMAQIREPCSKRGAQRNTSD
jgi:hypothetical protein